MEARAELEILLAGLAAERRDEAALVELRRCVEIMQHTTDNDEFVRADVDFHLGIARSTGNQSLFQIMKSIRSLMQVWIQRVATAPGTRPATWAEHSAVLEAIEAGDAAAARRAMVGHMEGAADRLQVTLAEQERRQPAPEAEPVGRMRRGGAMTGGLLQPLDLSQREGTTISISRQLLDYLLSGRVQPGDRLPPERKLAEALGVGRSVVREALKSLTLLGLLEVRLGDGTYVKRVDADILPESIEWGLVLGAGHVPDLLEARRHLDVILAGLAAVRRDERDMADLRALHAAMKAAHRDPVGLRPRRAPSCGP